eukprot:gene11797-biopygen10937
MCKACHTCQVSQPDRAGRSGWARWPSPIGQAGRTMRGGGVCHPGGSTQTRQYCSVQLPSHPHLQGPGSAPWVCSSATSAPRAPEVRLAHRPLDRRARTERTGRAHRPRPGAPVAPVGRPRPGPLDSAGRCTCAGKKRGWMVDAEGAENVKASAPKH